MKALSYFSEAMNAVFGLVVMGYAIYLFCKLDYWNAMIALGAGCGFFAASNHEASRRKRADP